MKKLTPNKPLRIKVSHFLSALVLLYLMLTAPVVYSQSTMLTVISNVKGAPAMLKKAELRSILLGERQRWRNGNKIIIALMKTNTEAGRNTCERIYNMSEDEVKKFWLAQVFGGKADPPSFFNSVSELLSFVAEHPGAIGIVDSMVPAAGTQVILIDGKRSL